MEKKKVNFESVIALIFAIMLGLCGWGLVYSQNQLDDATERIEALEQKVESKKQENDELIEEIKRAIEKNTKLNDSNKELNDNNQQIKEKNEKLKEEVKTLEGKVALKKKEEQQQQPVHASHTPVESKHTMTLEATMYIAFCDSGCIGITATGKDVSNTVYHNGRRVVAVDPNVIPLHTVMELEYPDGTREEVVALDTGGAIKGEKVDILVRKKSRAINFGRQDVTIRVLKWG